MVNENRLRFDISHSQPLTKDQLKAVENIVNEAILANLEIKIEYMEVEKAIEKGAKALFGEKYPKIARTVKIGKNEDIGFSFELCGGSHLKLTGGCGLFKIIYEGSIASGTRRVEAVCGERAIDYVRELQYSIAEISRELSTDSKNILDKIKSMQEDNKMLRKEIDNLKSKYYLSLLNDNFTEISGKRCLITIADFIETKDFRSIANLIIADNSNTFIFLSNKLGNKFSYIMGISKDLQSVIDIKSINKKILEIISGTGGGSNTLVQGQGQIDKSEEIKIYLEESLQR